MNHLLHSFNYEIHVDIVDNVFKRRISVVLNYIKKLHQLCQDLCLRLIEAQQQKDEIIQAIEKELKKETIERYEKKLLHCHF